jgi:outer membrane protein
LTIVSNRFYQTQIEVAKINSELAKLSERGVSNQLRKDIELAYSDLTNSIDQFHAAQKQYGFAERTFENAEYQYNNGLINPTEFFIEKNNFANAENNFVLAKYQYLFSRMIVNFYSGNSLEIE